MNTKEKIEVAWNGYLQDVIMPDLPSTKEIAVFESIFLCGIIASINILSCDDREEIVELVNYVRSRIQQLAIIKNETSTNN